MKKIFSLMAVAALSMGFTACEDIPAPYEIIEEIIGGEEEDIYYESTGLYTGWELFAVGENQPWSQGSSYTQATGYQKWGDDTDKSNREVKGYLVSPSFNTKAKSGKVRFSFDNTVRYTNNVKGWENNHRIYVSSDYEDGTDFNSATWEIIDWKSTESPYTDWTVYTSGNIALPEKYVNQENIHIAFYFYAPASSSTTWELMNFVIEEGEGDYEGTGFNPEDSDDPETPAADPVGTGTEADPFNVSAAIKYASALAADTNSEPIYIKGKVASFKSGEEPGNQYGNATFYISDDGSDSNTFYCFRVMGPGNKKWTSADQMKVGDEVVVYGPVVNYKGNTPETVQNKCYVYSINGATTGGNTDTPDTPTGESKGTGTAADPYNVAGIIAYTSKLAADVNSDKEVYFTGVVKNFKSGEEPGNQYGNATFYISDDSTSDDFYCFRVLGKDGKKFTEGAEAPAVGDKVTIRGLVVNYKGNTPETVSGKAYVEAIVKGEGGNTGGGETPGGGEVIGGSEENGDFETWNGSTPAHWKTTTTAGNATLSQSTDAHGGKYSVKVGGTTSGNKRLGREEMTLEAGKYTMTFWVKAATTAGGSVRPGYVPVTDDKVGSYVYGDYVNDLTADKWVPVTHTFDIASDGVYSLVIMNSKNPGADVLIDDFVLMKGDTKVISSKRRAAARRK